MKFLIDMNISPRTVQMLVDAGYDAIRVPRVLPANASDREILRWAGSHGYVIITQDMDFSSLIALQGGTEPSLLNVRLTSGDPVQIGERLLKIMPHIARDLNSGACITIDNTEVRVRNLPISS